MQRSVPVCVCACVCVCARIATGQTRCVFRRDALSLTFPTDLHRHATCMLKEKEEEKEEEEKEEEEKGKTSGKNV